MTTDEPTTLECAAPACSATLRVHGVAPGPEAEARLARLADAHAWRVAPGRGIWVSSPAADFPALCRALSALTEGQHAPRGRALVVPVEARGGAWLIDRDVADLPALAVYCGDFCRLVASRPGWAIEERPLPTGGRRSCSGHHMAAALRAATEVST
jgi:hypothetical protein